MEEGGQMNRRCAASEVQRQLRRLLIRGWTIGEQGKTWQVAEYRNTPVLSDDADNFRVVLILIGAAEIAWRISVMGRTGSWTGKL